MTDDPKSPEEDDSVTTTILTRDIEEILAKFIAEKGGVLAPYTYHFRWLWTVDVLPNGVNAAKGPLAHVKVTRAPQHVVPFRRKQKK
jgi:hypothetical protein